MESLHSAVGKLSSEELENTAKNLIKKDSSTKSKEATDGISSPPVSKDKNKREDKSVKGNSHESVPKHVSKNISNSNSIPHVTKPVQSHCSHETKAPLMLH